MIENGKGKWCLVVRRKKTIEEEKENRDVIV